MADHLLIGRSPFCPLKGVDATKNELRHRSCESLAWQNHSAQATAPPNKKQAATLIGTRDRLRTPFSAQLLVYSCSTEYLLETRNRYCCGRTPAEPVISSRPNQNPRFPRSSCSPGLISEMQYVNHRDRRVISFWNVVSPLSRSRGTRGELHFPGAAVPPLS